jgi:hypothetical protein
VGVETAEEVLDVSAGVLLQPASIITANMHTKQKQRILLALIMFLPCF